MLCLDDRATQDWILAVPPTLPTRLAEFLFLSVVRLASRWAPMLFPPQQVESFRV